MAERIASTIKRMFRIGVCRKKTSRKQTADEMKEISSVRSMLCPRRSYRKIEINAEAEMASVATVKISAAVSGGKPRCSEM